jgi:DNA-binding response OmpR family regulator
MRSETGPIDHYGCSDDQFVTFLTAGGVELDCDRKLARRCGRILRIGETEFRLLELLISYRGVVFYREQLVAILWGTKSDVDPRTVDQKVARLRKALTLGSAPDPIRSIRGKGYMFDESADRDYTRWQELGPSKLRLRRRLA